MRRAAAIWLAALGVAWTLGGVDAGGQSHEAVNQIPDLEVAVERCAENRFKELVRAGKVGLDPATGQGRSYDEILHLCREDPGRFTGRSPEEG